MKWAVWSMQIVLLTSCVGVSQERNEVRQVSEHTRATNPPRPASEIWAELMEGNRRFVSGKVKTRDLRSLRVSLANAQHPDVVVLTCSDSRIAPELLFDQSLGDLFVVRSAGNVADPVGVGSIEYAVDHLGSSVVLVLGHTKCGAVTSACSGEKVPSPNLQAIVDKIEPAVARSRVSSRADNLIEAAIKENVHQSVTSLLASSEVLRHSVAQGKLSIFEAEYQLDTGEVILLSGPGR